MTNASLVPFAVDSLSVVACGVCNVFATCFSRCTTFIASLTQWLRVPSKHRNGFQDFLQHFCLVFSGALSCTQFSRWSETVQ